MLSGNVRLSRDDDAMEEFIVIDGVEVNRWSVATRPSWVTAVEGMLINRSALDKIPIAQVEWPESRCPWFADGWPSKGVDESEFDSMIARVVEDVSKDARTYVYPVPRESMRAVLSKGRRYAECIES